MTPWWSKWVLKTKSVFAVRVSVSRAQVTMRGSAASHALPGRDGAGTGPQWGQLLILWFGQKPPQKFLELDGGKGVQLRLQLRS